MVGEGQGVGDGNIYEHVLSFRPVVGDDVARFPSVQEPTPVLESYGVPEVCESLSQDCPYLVVP